MELLISNHPLAALHPFDGEAEHFHVQFAVRRLKDAIEFDFVLTGRVAAELDKVVLPALIERHAARRKHDLWKSTCMEVFVGPAHESFYVELNLSPAGHWNVYGFDSYRSGQREIPEARAQWVKHEKSATGDQLSWHGRLVSVQAGGELERLLTASHLALSATCVVEYKSGDREYWALAHAAEKPDFHRRESFRLSI